MPDQGYVLRSDNTSVILSWRAGTREACICVLTFERAVVGDEGALVHVVAASNDTIVDAIWLEIRGRRVSRIADAIETLFSVLALGVGITVVQGSSAR